MYKRRYLPLAAYLLFVFFVFFSLYIEPFKYKGMNYSIVLLYVFFVTLMFSIGYILGVARPMYTVEWSNLFYSQLAKKRNTRFILNCILHLGFVVVFSSWYEFIKSGGSFSISSIGEMYMQSYSGYVRGAANVDLPYLLNIFAYTIISLCLFFAAYYLPMFNRYQQYLFIFICGSYLLLQVLGSGKQKYLGDFVVCFAVYLTFIKNRSHKKLNLMKIIFLIISFLLIVFLFVEILRQRYVAAGIGKFNIDMNTHPLIFWDHNSVIFFLFGDEYGFSLGMFLGYFTNGLFGLSLCLNLPFEWTYFVGNSYSLTRIVEIIIGNNGLIFDSTYPVRAGESFGWGLSKWHSLYSWMASDFTFTGVVIIAGIFGYIYGRLWIEAINAKNIASGPLFTIFSLGLVFSLSNNQLMHGMPGILSLFFTILLWVAASKFAKHTKTSVNEPSWNKRVVPLSPPWLKILSNVIFYRNKRTK